ncbi:hypothetical protein H2O64_04910 [Kordia sp. YSTF-M3]|uniref:Spore protein YkvP/CgeB glycosyl transferase-like domain-containing protein n=1 Tax=Kordia aestuariivivens TaxID=2759037 RepID=A0ABR7Q612_9FLAO|nr:glycosyltransferase [Kordia aestuariivivens]MBC8753999.1 hypothetical protein [Kordia aestuariivivens]
MPNHTKIVIDASSRIYYASYYIQGLCEVFGKRNVTFSNAYFSDLKRKEIEFSFEHYFAFVVIQPDKSLKKIVIDFCDPPDINETAHKWCDIYAKINFNHNETAKEFLEKIISIPPSFSIKIWNKRETFYHCFNNLIKCKFSPIIGFKRFFQDYYVQNKRPQLHDYTNSDTLEASPKPYIFMIATLWGANGKKTNQQRKTFIELVKAKQCNFEGGFLTKEITAEMEGFKDFIFTEAYSSKAYIEKTKRSDFVFNTPAVHKCHGWKLAEYLAMGKTIISTPPYNEMPENLKHSENIHIASDHEELAAAIHLMLNNAEYKNTLGKNAQAYFETFVSPKPVINRILEKVI